MMFDLLTLCMTVIIEPGDDRIEERKFTTTKGGKEKEIKVRNQSAYYVKPSRRHPQFFQLSIPEGQAAYAPGRYFIHPDSFETGDYDVMELSRYDLKLIPVPTELQKPIGTPASGKQAATV